MRELLANLFDEILGGSKKRKKVIKKRVNTSDAAAE